MAHETFERGGRASVSEGLCMERVLMESAVSSGQTIGVTWSATDPASMSAPRQHAEGGRLPLGSSSHEAKLCRLGAGSVSGSEPRVRTLIDSGGLVDKQPAWPTRQ